MGRQQVVGGQILVGQPLADHVVRLGGELVGGFLLAHVAPSREFLQVAVQMLPAEHLEHPIVSRFSMDRIDSTPLLCTSPKRLAVTRKDSGAQATRPELWHLGSAILGCRTIPTTWPHRPIETRIVYAGLTGLSPEVQSFLPMSTWRCPRHAQLGFLASVPHLK